MRKLLILLVFLCSCATAERKLLHPDLAMPEFDVCLIDVKYPEKLFCKNVFSYDGKVKEYEVRFKSEGAWVALRISDFQTLVAFMRQYCRENTRACGKMGRKLRALDKRGGK